MKKNAVLLFFSICLLLTSCSKSIGDLKIGMSAKEVIDLVGEPARTSKPLIGGKDGEMDLNVDGEHEVQWTYPSDGHIYFEKGKLIRIEKK